MATIANTTPKSSASPGVAMPTTTSVTSESRTTPDGTLFKIPRQVRDEIYRLLVKGRYLVLSESPPSGTESTEPSATAHLAILRASKVISHEALRVMYSESRFCCGLEFDHHVLHGNPPPVARSVDAVLRPLLAAIDRMMNIEISILSHCRAVDARHIRDTMFDKILGTQIQRNTLHIQIHGRVNDLLSTNMFRKIGLMTIFNTITIQFDQRRVGNSGSIESAFEIFEDALGTRLGPAVTGYVYHPTSSSPVPRWGYLRFHPRHHSTEVLARDAKDSVVVEGAGVSEQGLSG